MIVELFKRVLENSIRLFIHKSKHDKTNLTRQQNCDCHTYTLLSTFQRPLMGHIHTAQQNRWCLTIDETDIATMQGVASSTIAIAIKDSTVDRRIGLALAYQCTVTAIPQTTVVPRASWTNRWRGEERERREIISEKGRLPSLQYLRAPEGTRRESKKRLRLMRTLNI